MRILSFCLVALMLAIQPALAAWDCTWGKANYDQRGWLRNVQIFRNGKRIADITHVDTLDVYYVQCNGISGQETFNTANDAAWAACWKCK